MSENINELYEIINKQNKELARLRHIVKYRYEEETALKDELITKLARRISRLSGDYEALAKSKLGRITLKYWRFKDKYIHRK